MTKRQRVSALKRDCIRRLKWIRQSYERAGVPAPYIRELVLLGLYRVAPELAREIDG